MFGFRPLPRTLEAAVRDARTASRDVVKIEAVRDLGRYARSEDEVEQARAIEVLCEQLIEAPVAAVRGEAALALADAGAERAAPSLIRAAKDENQRVRQMALVALGELAAPGDRDATQALRAAFATDVPELRYQALIGLARLKPGDDAPLIRSLTDEDAEIRYIAVRLCEERFGTGPVPHQVELRAERALKDADPRVRTVAAHWLVLRGNESARDLVVEFLNGFRKKLAEDDEVALVELAGELGLEAARPGLERRAFGLAPGPAAWHARVALGRMGDARASERLLRGLRAWTRDARTHAVVAVGKARIASARPRLLEMRERKLADDHAISEALAELEAKAG